MQRTLNELILWCDEGRYLGPSTEYEKALKALEEQVKADPEKARSYLEEISSSHGCARAKSRRRAYILNALGN